MKRILVTILTIFAVGSTLRAQTIPWKFQTTSRQHYFVFSNAPTANFDSIPVDSGDVLAAIYDSAGFNRCAGYLVFDGNLSDDTLIAYGQDVGDNGFMGGEIITFQFWRRGKDCFVYNPTMSVSNYQFIDGVLDTIYSLNAFPVRLTYSREEFCINQPSGTVVGSIVNGGIGEAGYIVTTPGLDLNGDDGIITLANSTPGTYYIIGMGMSGNCAMEDSVKISIYSNLGNPVNAGITHPNCDIDFGHVYVDTIPSFIGTAPIRFELRSQMGSTVHINFTGTFLDIAKDDYWLSIMDDDGCGDSIQVTVGKPLDCNTEAILTPLLNTEYSTFNIEWAGESTIYNAIGQKVRTLVTPADWDGTDDNGQPLGTGDYIIFTNNEKKGTVTIIY